jgi:hypothetical protein
MKVVIIVLAFVYAGIIIAGQTEIIGFDSNQGLLFQGATVSNYYTLEFSQTIDGPWTNWGSVSSQPITGAVMNLPSPFFYRIVQTESNTPSPYTSSFDSLYWELLSNNSGNKTSDLTYGGPYSFVYRNLAFPACIRGVSYINRIPATTGSLRIYVTVNGELTSLFTQIDNVSSNFSSQTISNCAIKVTPSDLIGIRYISSDYTSDAGGAAHIFVEYE